MVFKKRRMRSRNIRQSRKENSMPTGLILAEIFLAVMCASYAFKITGTMMDIAADDALYPSVINAFMLQMNLVFLVTTVFALLGISSRRAESWKKVVRTCFTFTFSTFMSAFLVQSDSFVHEFDFNPYATAIVLGIVVLMMLFSEDIKKFYTPPLTKVRPTASWANYILFGKLYNVEYQVKIKQPDAAVNEETQSS
jgi:hypothetical protein